MKKIFIKDIKEKDKVEDIFIVSKKEQGMSKSGKPYLNLKLMDSTGEIEARVWEDADNLSKLFEKDNLIFVKAYAVLYQGGVQLNVSHIEKKELGDSDIALFLPSSQNDISKMFEELKEIINSEIKGINLKKLLHLFTSDPEIVKLLKLAPAAKSMHHTYIGGLIEHTLSLVKLAMDAAKHYPNINRDILLAGAILHDIGKIYELSFQRTFDYTDEGRLLGHITIGVEMVDKKIREISNFPKETAMLLKHIILSHHGYLEFGSPKRPKTLEAIMLYYLDDMDSKIQSMSAHIEKERDTDSKWTSFHKLYERYIYKGIP